MAGQRPTYYFLTVVSLITLASDIFSKTWAERTLRWSPDFVVIENLFGFRYAQNKGGAWGLLQTTNENVRRPFFLLVSVAAIAFIMSLYRKLNSRQLALKWGLPLVLGGALGNVFDRVRYGYVVDFIDFHMIYKGEDHHWPTFNVADIAICIGVILMALDMFTSKKDTGVWAGPALVEATAVEPAVEGVLPSAIQVEADVSTEAAPATPEVAATAEAPKV
ncbi:MAG: signal peptidase II [Polyangiaceae bacterium]|nr:signal peptidase II [Polyangiaceae bacterium]